MPTDPLESLLYRELSKVEAKKIIEIASPLLQELVNYSTNVLARCAHNPKALSGKDDEDVAAFALYRHMIELTDGIEVLISQCCSIPAIPILRSSFEALLAIEYILENDQNYVQRSLAWLTGYAHERQEMYERLDPSTNRGNEAKRLFENDQVKSTIQFPPIAVVQNSVANLQSFFAKPHIQQIDLEYKKKKKRSSWYSLFQGPNDLRTLADHLKRGWEYEILYRHWSTTTHAQDLLQFMDRTSDGKPAIGRLRRPDQVREIAVYASSFMLASTQRMLKKFRPGEEDNLERWFINEVKTSYLALTDKNDKA